MPEQTLINADICRNWTLTRDSEGFGEIQTSRKEYYMAPFILCCTIISSLAGDDLVACFLKE